MVARVMTVVRGRTKSSAVSVSIFPKLTRRDSAPSRPSGVPVLKKNISAHAGVANHSPTRTVVVNESKKFLNPFIFPSFLSMNFLPAGRDQIVRDHRAKRVFHVTTGVAPDSGS